MGCEPVVSVIIPAFNGESTIENALTSILNQTYRPLEIIVVDDCSKDGTKDIAKKFCQSDQRIRLIEHRENLGLAATLNHGFFLANGPFVVIVHQDCELLRNDWIDCALALINGDRETAVVTGFPLYPIGELNVYEKAFIVIRDNLPKIVQREEIPFSEFRCDMLRKDVIKDAGWFCSEKFRISGEDQMLSYGLRKSGHKIVRFKELNYTLRMNQESLLKNLKKEHTFGKTQAGIILNMPSGALSHVSTSRNTMRRMVNRSVALFTFSTSLLTLLLLLIFGNLIVLAIGLSALFIRFMQYARRGFSYRNDFHFSPCEALLVPALGFISDFIYGVSFSIGLMLAILRRRL